MTGILDKSTGKSVAIGRACILSASVLWSLSGVFVKTIAMPPEVVAMYRTLAAGGFLLVMMALSRTRPTWHPAMLIMVAAFSLMNYFFIASTTYTTSANAIFLQYTAPFWMTLGGVFLLGERSDRRHWVILCGTLAGVGVIIAGNAGSGGNNLSGIKFGLVSGFMYATVTLSLRFLRNHDPLWLAAANLLTAGLALLAFEMVLAQFGRLSRDAIAIPSDPGKIAMLTAFGVVQMGIPYVLFGIGLRRVTAQEAGILTLIEPVLNPIWTYLANGEKPSSPTIVGGVILIGMLAARYYPTTTRSASNPEKSQEPIPTES